MVEVGRDLWGSSSPIPLPKQGHPEQVAQDLVQGGFEYLQRRRNLSWQPVPGLCHPQSEEVLPHVQLELPLLQFVPVAPCPVAGHHWKVWLHPPDTHPADIYKHLLHPLIYWAPFIWGISSRRRRRLGNFSVASPGQRLGTGYGAGSLVCSQCWAPGPGQASASGERQPSERRPPLAPVPFSRVVWIQRLLWMLWNCGLLRNQGLAGCDREPI